MPIDTRVENCPNVMINAPIFAQLIALMWKASQWVLVTKFQKVLELWAIKFESTKKSPFQYGNLYFQIWWLVTQKPLENFGAKTHLEASHINA